MEPIIETAAKVAEPQTAEVVEGTEVTAAVEAKTDTPEQAKAEKPEKDLTKRTAERINQIREKEVAPLKAELEKIRKAKEEADIELQALREDRPIDEVRKEREDEGKKQKDLIDEYIKNDPEIKRLKEMEFEVQYKEVLSALQKDFPNDNIEKLEDLGDEFFAMIGAGVKVPVAYKAWKESTQADKPAPKPSTGTVKESQDVPKTGTYDLDDIKNMSRAEILKNYESVMASIKGGT